MSERWGNYILEARLGAGGMAEVFAARRVGPAQFSRRVCIKRVHPHLASDPTFLNLFLDEARMGAQLHHQNIVAIDELGEHQGTYFLAMEFVDGTDLANLIRLMREKQTSPPPDVVCFVAMEVLAALEYAHTALAEDNTALRMVHRDVCPHNILISRAGEVKLGDFGIARATRRVVNTDNQVIRGRRGYMPVEQSSGLEVDARTDLYALGVTLFEFATLRSPFHSGEGEPSIDAVITAQLMDRRVALTQLRQDLPDVMVRMIEAMLSRDASERPRSAKLVAEVLRTLPHASSGRSSMVALLRSIEPRFARGNTAIVSQSTLRRWLTRLPDTDAPPAKEPRSTRLVVLVSAILIALLLGSLIAALSHRARTPVGSLHPTHTTRDASISSSPDVHVVVLSALRDSATTLAPTSLDAAASPVAIVDASLPHEASTGWISITARPWAIVRVDNNASLRIGPTPKRFQLPAGMHSIVLSGGVSWRGSVVVHPGRTTVILKEQQFVQ